MIWLVALPSAFVLVGVPARKLGYLNSQRLLDVVVKTSLARFVPLLLFVLVWAFATTVLVQAAVSTISWQRRRTSRVPDFRSDNRRRTRRGDDDFLTRSGQTPRRVPDGRAR